MSTPGDVSVANVKIKQEKIDPEIERKLNPNTLPDSTKLDEDVQMDEKKNIEPVKSSNEILAELFKVFNATPPAGLLNTDKPTKKPKKGHKKSKHKKSKKRKHKSGENSDISDNESIASGVSKHKHKKKHKRKHKKSKDNSLELDDDEKKTSAERTVIMAADSSSSTKLKHSIKEEPIENIEIKIEKSQSKNESRTRVEKRLRNCTQVEECSDTTLSDEETYLREKSRYNEMNSTESPKRMKYDRYRSNNSFYRNSYYSGDRQDRSYYHRNRYRSRSRTRTKSRSRSKTRSPVRDLGIDKKRLLEIARKNAITMFKNGSLPGCAGMSEEVKDKVLMKMRYGGKTVQDLTNFCRKLTKGENYDDLSEFSSEEESDVDKQGNTKAFHHPFVLKEREPIVMHIRNAKPIAPKTADQKKAITMQFPVSSGQQHRMTEGWVPVPAKEPEPVPSVPPIVKPILTKTLGVPKNVFQKQLPVEEQQPAFKPLGVNGVPDSVTPPIPDTAPPAMPEIQQPPPVIPPIPISVAPVPVPCIPLPVPAAEPPPPPPPAIFTPAPTNMDVSAIISQRLSAMRRLQENPMDCEAIKMMYNSQKEMTTWASSQNMPGQFTGSTGANILSARELTSGSQAWARKDQLKSTVPVSGGMGMHLLKKMGWKPGEGLGREKTGSLQPLLLDVKLDKRGLVADEEVNGNRRPKSPLLTKRKKNGPGQPIQKQSLDTKHPVCLLNELSTKRKWTPPMYELVTDEGPSHNKFFVFSVNVNGQVFNPGAGGNTKKEAKLLTARYCLQQMGILS